jgi:hypothetical protein
LIKVIVIICPGIHDSALTDSFLQALEQQQVNRNNFLVCPTAAPLAVSALHLLHFLQQQLKPTSQSLVFISFSAGVVGAMGAAWMWQQWGGKVRALIALDGWGVPLIGNFPLHRLSHDHFTHWSSALLGGGPESFYADPPVEHLDLWRSPHRATGWFLQKTANGNEVRSPTTAVAFLAMLLTRYNDCDLPF